MQIKIKIKHDLSSREIVADTETRLADLKMMIQAMTDIEEVDQVLTFNDRVLVDDRKSLAQLGVREGAVMCLKAKRRRPSEPGQAAQGNPAELLKNPFVQNLMKNPEGMKSMMSMFPGLEKEIDKNDELRQMVNNPNFMEEMNKLAADPEYFNQQAKNADVAMARLETLPGGLNMISSMVKEVNDPISDVMTRDSAEIKGGHQNSDVERAAVPNPKVTVNWLVHYRKQINELNRFGFTDIQQNLIALKQCKGDLKATILFLTNK